jgi:hypothetical protein
MLNQDQIDAVMAQSVQADVARAHSLLAWVVTRNEAVHPGQYVARLMTDAITPPLPHTSCWPIHWENCVPCSLPA